MLMPMFSPAAGVAAADVSYLTVVDSSANATTYNFTSVTLGTAASDRYIFVVCHFTSSSGASRSISSASIGGVSAAIAISASTDGLSTEIGCGVFSAAVPTGTTGTISVTLDSTGGSCQIGVYRVTGLGSQTAVATNSNSGTNPSTTVDVNAGGFVLGGLIHSVSTQAVSWTGLTEQYDFEISDGSPERVSGAFASALGSETGKSVSVSGNAGGTGLLAVASFA